MTLGEFLHPLNKSSQRDLVLALMYYLKRYEGRDAVTTADLAAAFKRAKHAKGRKIANLAAVMNGAVPYVESPGSNGRHLLWALTGTGENHVRDLLGLPQAEPEVEHDVSTLQTLAASITDEAVRGYVDEAIVCLRVGALRAATVFLWAGAVVTLRDKVWAHGAPAIDAALKSHNPKARDFKKKDDFSYVKDASLIQVAQDLSVVDKSEKDLAGPGARPAQPVRSPGEVHARRKEGLGVRGGRRRDRLAVAPAGPTSCRPTPWSRGGRSARPSG
jgi:hypothetical protein